MFQAIYKNVFKAGVLAGCVMGFFTSCKKQMPPEIFPSSLTIVNAVNDNSSFLTVYYGETQPKIYALLSFIKNGDYYDFVTGKTSQPITVYRNNDTLHTSSPFVKNRLDLEPGGIYTHFIYGSPAKPLQKTIKEQLPARSLNDSVAHLRIANFFDNRSVDVIQLEPVPGTMVSNLAYEQVSGFIKVPVTRSVQNFRFEIKDHATGETLTTLTETNLYPGTVVPNVAWLFKARTMLVKGTWTGPGNFAANATTVGHY